MCNKLGQQSTKDVCELTLTECEECELSYQTGMFSGWYSNPLRVLAKLTFDYVQEKTLLETPTQNLADYLGVTADLLYAENVPMNAKTEAALGRLALVWFASVSQGCFYACFGEDQLSKLPAPLEIAKACITNA